MELTQVCSSVTIIIWHAGQEEGLKRFLSKISTVRLRTGAAARFSLTLVIVHILVQKSSRNHARVDLEEAFSYALHNVLGQVWSRGGPWSWGDCQGLGLISCFLCTLLESSILFRNPFAAPEEAIL